MASMDLFAAYAESHPGKTALVCGGRRIDWATLSDLALRAAAGFSSLGLGPGDTSMVFSGNSIEFLVASAGIRRAGGITVPVNRHLSVSELSWHVEDCGPELLFTDAERFSIADGASPRPRSIVVTGMSPEAPAAVSFEGLIEDSSPAAAAESPGGFMFYTSGTTGKPKAAVHDAPPDVQVGATYAQAFGLRSDDVHLVAGPLYHSAPAAFCALTLSLSGTVVVMPTFDPERALALIETERVTTTFMAPLLLQRILRLGAERLGEYDTSTLRALVVAGAPCPFHVKEQALAAFGEVLYEFYGSTETKAALYLRPEDQLRKPGSCGVPFPGVEVRLAVEDGSPPEVGEPGEIWVRRNSSTFAGYLGDPEKTAATIRGDWIATGDVAYRDAEGYYYICDRLSDMVISGGVNIYPAEIEAALMEHPAVADVAVVGVPDHEWGERLHAFVESGDGSVDFESLEMFLRGKIASFKVPRSWEEVKVVPRGDDGKVVKRALKQEFLRRRVGR